ncbi:MAG: metal ABC transporter substrate-binding protein [Bacteroidota bacterium]|nr:metal ABC transporter substrate-binding protein [Patescibacteria group bacterium]
MKKSYRLPIVFIGVVIITLLILSLYSPSKRHETDQKLKVATTIFPLTDIAKNIGGDKVEVINLVPPGASPHTFEVTAEQARKLQGTRTIFSIGHGLDDWIINTTSALPRTNMLCISSNISLRDFKEHHSHDQEIDPKGSNNHEHEEVDPHYWLSIRNAKIISTNISEELQRLDPDNSDYYKINSQNYIKKLESLDSQIQTLLSNISNNEIMTMHNAWSYFAADYGLEIAATFEPFPGQEPTPKYLVELSKKAQEHNLKTFFSEPQLSNQILIPFLKDMGMSLSVLDPIGGLEKRDTYINLMMYNAEVIYEQLK